MPVHETVSHTPIAPEEERWWESDPVASIDARIKQAAALQLPGEASIPARNWGIQGGGREHMENRSVSYDELIRLGQGWKFHLNFDARDPNKVQAVQSVLRELQKAGVVSQFKLGNGGGEEAGAPGKEATVGIGHRDKADMVAPIIEELLSGVLDAPEGDVLKDDIPFTSRVFGRFDVEKIDPTIHKYGAQGHGLLAEDMLRFATWGSGGDNTAASQITTEAAARANDVLTGRYGVFYTGSTKSV